MRRRLSRTFPGATLKMRFWLVLLSVLLVLPGGCVYRLGGGGKGGTKRIAIPVFVNRTFEPLVDKRVTTFVQRAFVEDGRWEVVNAPGTADLVLRGQVTGLGLTPLSFDRTGRVTEYRVQITVDVELASPKGAAVWSGKGLTATAEYLALSDVVATRSNHDRAIEEACQRLALDLVSRFAEGF